MTRILITSGPTRQYLDPVRYLSNASSGRMGAALAEAAVDAGHEVVVISGPVDVSYPSATQVIGVESTEELLEACKRIFPTCDGLIAAAAPCDYQPVEVAFGKIPKDGEPLVIELFETPDVVASLAEDKGSRWIIVFALETQDRHARALAKLRRKKGDLVVVNGPESIGSRETSLEVLDRQGTILTTIAGDKSKAAEALLAVAATHLIEKASARR
jgi:phosphopantothenoylcysteine decarboxylase/phosphopantothenate--cysteine ligase